jgi:alpha/beta superfamily hydrolase
MPEIIFNGPAGRLEGRYTHNDTPKAPVAIVLHPHPLHGGTMNNKIAYNLFKALVNNGFSVLRFNFRGVGKSQGKFDDGIGELADATTAAMDWLQTQNPNANIFWVSGFSFGAWIAMQLLMRRPEVMGFISVAPPANNYDFSFLSPCTASGLILQGGADTIAPESHTAKFADKLSAQKNIEIDYQVIDNADHFFRENMDDVYNIINEYVENKISIDKDIVSKKRIGKRKRKSRKSKIQPEIS